MAAEQAFAQALRDPGAEQAAKGAIVPRSDGRAAEVIEQLQKHPVAEDILRRRQDEGAPARGAF